MPESKATQPAEEESLEAQRWRGSSSGPSPLPYLSVPALGWRRVGELRREFLDGTDGTNSVGHIRPYLITAGQGLAACLIQGSQPGSLGSGPTPYRNSHAKTTTYTAPVGDAVRG